MSDNLPQATGGVTAINGIEMTPVLLDAAMRGSNVKTGSTGQS